ncbi:MAG: DNA polymerase III subunit delta [Sphingobacterium sp.]
MDVRSILADIKQKKLAPVYLLHGEEPYYIDIVSDTIENSVLQDGQKGFDQTVVYGKETDFNTLISMAKRYPMMSEHQVIVIKEAQNMRWKEDEVLQKYLLQPLASTVLVFSYKYGKIDKRRKVYNLFKQQGVVVESNKIYDDKVANWINEQMSSNDRKIHPQAAALMAEYLGSDLSKIAGEIDKLQLNIAKDQEISVKDIEANIGISKDFNVFELNSALAKRDAVKALRIVSYFAANPKSNPIPVVIGSLGTYFTKILKYHYLGNKIPSEAAKLLGVHPFFVKEYELAARNFNRKKTFDIIHHIKEYDLKAKGVDVGPYTDPSALLTELVFKILN